MKLAFCRRNYSGPQSLGNDLALGIWPAQGGRRPARSSSGIASAPEADRDTGRASRKPVEAARLARLALDQARSNRAVIALLRY